VLSKGCAPQQADLLTWLHLLCCLKGCRVERERSVQDVDDDEDFLEDDSDDGRAKPQKKSKSKSKKRRASAAEEDDEDEPASPVEVTPTSLAT
jgi:hypothetical protein